MDLQTIRETLSRLRARPELDVNSEMVECIDSLAEIIEEHQRVLRNHAREIQSKGIFDPFGGRLGL